MGVSFLTPTAALFGLAALVPLAALVVIERRSARIRRSLGAPALRRRSLVPIVLALLLLPALVAVAAAQPVVVHEKLLSERGDAQGIFVFDTSLSMAASESPTAPSRLDRAKALALAIRGRLGDVPIEIVSMTDRALPVLMPTTDAALFARTLSEAVAVDQPPPSQKYPGRATTLSALSPIDTNHFFSSGVKHRLLVVFTDGEASPLSQELKLTLQPGRYTAPLFVHVWSAADRIYRAGGHVDRAYTPDPTSALDLAQYANLSGGRVFDEHSASAVAAAAREVVGHGPRLARLSAYARIALAPWLVLIGVVPLALLLWKRNL